MTYKSDARRIKQTNSGQQISATGFDTETGQVISPDLVGEVE